MVRFVVDDFVRPVMKREKNTLLHWWYTPDSYDTWVTDVHIDLDVDDLYDPDGAWEVLVSLSMLELDWLSYFMPWFDCVIVYK